MKIPLDGAAEKSGRTLFVTSPKGQYVVGARGSLQNARMTDRLADNLQRVTAEIATACDRASRSPNDVTLVAVTKYADMAWVRRLVELGIRDLAESRPQQLVERAEQLPSDIRWHQIGHLQRNKVKSLLARTAMIH